MNRRVAVVGLLLIAFGLSVFAWKAFVLELPLQPTQPGGLWQVEMQITARGSGGEGSIRAALPSSGPGQRVFGERWTSDGLRFSIRSGAEGRTGVWSGRMKGVHRIVYEFRVDLFPATPVPATGAAAARNGAAREDGDASLDKEVREAALRSTTDLPAGAEEIREHLAALDLPRSEDADARVRAIYSAVTHEIDTVDTASTDALLTLAQREGSARGKERLLVTLLRASGVPSRIVQGLQLGSGPPRPRIWTEAWLGGRWVPMSTTAGFFGELPAELLTLRSDDRDLVEETGLAASGYALTAREEQLSPEELGTLMVPPSPGLARFSLYQLAVPQQAALRLLLLLPLGALAVAVLRNVVGMPSYGTFMPVLIALALRGTGLARGLSLVAMVL
ncbi:MAG: UUP1 family membrane protein, partial [Thermodesulfobacteriota bacterium]